MDEELNDLVYRPVEKTGMLLSVVITDGYITDYCTGGFLQDETTHLYVEDIPEDFYGNFKAYKVKDNALVLDTKKLPDVETERELMNLRAQREIECFSIVNRGVLWYNRLNEEQLKELDSWYQAWLDVTESKAKSGYKIPTKPRWLE